MLGGKKHQFYVQFLGWMETGGVRGTRYTDPVVHDLRKKARKWKYAPKLTLQVSKKEMKITQDVQEEKKRGKKIKTIKFPIIPSRDITYAVQALSPVDGARDDIVACIYLGYVPRTQRYVHVHVYRFDSPDTATTFTRYLNQIIASFADRTDDIERQLVQQGHIEDPRGSRTQPYRPPRHNNNNNYRFNSSDGMSDKGYNEDSAAESGSFSDDAYPSGSDEIEADLQSLREAVPFDSVTDELKTRLRLTETNNAAPLLLPPKDYDTVVRRHGHLDKADKRKCLQIPIVGDSKIRNGSDESGIDIPSPTSSEGKPAMDISDDKISSSAHSGSNDAPSPITSPRDYDIYPPVKSPRSPMTPSSTNSFERVPRGSRNVSTSSAYSSRSSGQFPDSGSTIIYGGPSHVAEIPPADYASEAPIMRHKNHVQSARDLTKSMPASLLQQEIDYGYAVHPQRRSRNSANLSDAGQSPRISGQSPRIQSPRISEKSRSSRNSAKISKVSELGLSPRVDMDYGRNVAVVGGVRRTHSMYR